MSDRAETTVGQPASDKAPLWKRLLPVAVGLTVVVVLFGWVLPQFIDYEAVFRVIGKIDAAEWLVLIVLAAARFIPEGWVYTAAQPGLSTGQGTQLFLVSETLSNVPPGGLDLVARYQMARSWGYSAGSSTSATIAGWIFASFSKLVLPIAAVGFLAVRRVRQDEVDLVALIAFGAVILGALAVYLVLRSPDLAGRVGDLLGRAVRRVSGLFRRDVKTDFRGLVLEFRSQASDVLRQRTALGLTVGVTARIAGFAVLLLAVRFVGIGADQLHWTIVFGAFAVTMALGVIPIFSMPGITEAILIAAMTSAAGSGASDEIAAAVFVYRILTWLLPIPFGGFAFNRWRSQVQASGKTELLDAFDRPEEEPA